MATSPTSNRLIALDYLRGFLIIVIIIDHLSWWPNFLEVFTGAGLLWVNAAPGFMIISGLLVGYVRGYKNRDQDFRSVSKKLLLRAGLLYAWLCAATILYTLILWLLPHASSFPWSSIEIGNWRELLWQTVTLEYTHVWVHFLYFYAIFLALSPIAIYLLRRRLALVAIALSIIGYAVGLIRELDWLQWQTLFFLPAIAGYYLTDIQKWWEHSSPTRRYLYKMTIYSTTLLTMSVSIMTTRIIEGSDIANFINTFFGKQPLTATTILLAFVWFTAFLLLFERYKLFIGRYFGWLLEPFGARSLTAYILHGLAVTVCVTAFYNTGSIVHNTLVGCLCIIITWWLIKHRLVQQVIPR